MSYYSDTTDIPDVPGPTYDRLLAVRFLHSIFFEGTVVESLNTQQKGYEGWVIRVRSVLGHVLVVISYKGMTRLTPWANVFHAIPHPDFRFDQGPVVFAEGWQELPGVAPWEFPRNGIGETLDEKVPEAPAKRGRGRPPLSP